MIRQAEATADRLRGSSGSTADKVKRAYETFFARPPTAKETQAALDFLSELRPDGDADRSAWAAFCQALFASRGICELAVT